MKKCLILLTLFCGLGGSILQAQNGWLLEVGAGAKAGWWIYDKGSDDPDRKNTLGWDRSFLAILPDANVQLGYQAGKWKFGLGTQFLFLAEETMISSRDRWISLDRYRISDAGGVPIWLYFGWVEYDLVQTNRFSFGPQLKVGSFSLDHTHPDAQYMRGRWFWEAGLSHDIRLKKFSLLLQPNLISAHIAQKKPGITGDDHQITAFGLRVGLRFRF